MNCLKDFLKRQIESYDIRLAKKYQRDVIFNSRRLSAMGKFDISKEQKTEIQEYYSLHYGGTIDPISHRTYTFYSGKFDVKYFPELIYIPEFEFYMNPYMFYNKAFYDKNVTSLLANAIGVKTPHVFAKRIKGLWVDEDNTILTKELLCSKLYNIGRVFVKQTTDTGGGNGCSLANFQKGVDVLSGELLTKLLSNWGNDIVIQECLKCHKSLTSLYDKSVNTFRILTYRWKDEIISIPAILRIGQGGGFLDNAHQGGMFVSVDNDGRLGSQALTETCMRYKEHPDTKTQFEGYTIPLFDKVRKAAVRMHSALPMVGVVNWDFTIDEYGNPVLIEGNMRLGGIWVFQMAHGKGAFGDKTSEILEWVKIMKQSSPSDRKCMLFGKI